MAERVDEEVRMNAGRGSRPVFGFKIWAHANASSTYITIAAYTTSNHTNKVEFSFFMAGVGGI